MEWFTKEDAGMRLGARVLDAREHSGWIGCVIGYREREPGEFTVIVEWANRPRPGQVTGEEMDLAQYQANCQEQEEPDYIEIGGALCETSH